MTDIESDMITPEMFTVASQAFDAYANDEFRSLGFYIGTITTNYCPLSKKSPV